LVAGLPGFLRARGRGFGASSGVRAGSTAGAGEGAGVSSAGAVAGASGLRGGLGAAERPGDPPFCARNAGAFAGLARFAATFSAWARVHLNRCPTRPRCNCCLRHDEEQKWKRVPSRLTYIEPVPGSISAAQNEH